MTNLQVGKFCQSKLKDLWIPYGLAWWWWWWWCWVLNNFPKNKVCVSGQLCSQTAHFGRRKSENPIFFRVSPRDLQLWASAAFPISVSTAEVQMKDSYETWTLRNPSGAGTTVSVQLHYRSTWKPFPLYKPCFLGRAWRISIPCGSIIILSWEWNREALLQTHLIQR